MGLLRYEQIAYEIYLLAILVVFIARLQWQDSSVAYGPPRKHWIAAARAANHDTFYMAAAVFAVIYATKDNAISRQYVALFLITSWILLLILNRNFPTLITRYLFQGNARMRTVLVGSPERIRELKSWTENQEALGIEVCGAVVFDRSEMADDQVRLPVHGQIEDLDEVVRKIGVQQIVLLESRHSSVWVQYVIDTCQERGCRLLVYNPWQEFSNQPMHVVTEGDKTFFTLQDEPLQNPMNRILKRLLDISIALPVSLLVLPPLALWVKIMQSIQAPGPLLFRQQRTGHEQNSFVIYKFRTMQVSGSSREENQAKSGDPRVYSFGAFLRRTSLDEFPQFINVLQGNMSVVGPRPHLIAHDEAFSQQMTVYRDRHFAKPGITGLAQNHGYRGEIRCVEDIEQRIALDLQYIHQWSFWLDLGIILKTAWQILRPPPSAY